MPDGSTITIERPVPPSTKADAQPVTKVEIKDDNLFALQDKLRGLFAQDRFTFTPPTVSKSGEALETKFHVQFATEDDKAEAMEQRANSFLVYLDTKREAQVLYQLEERSWIDDNLAVAYLDPVQESPNSITYKIKIGNPSTFSEWQEAQ